MNKQGDKDDMWLTWREEDMNTGSGWGNLNKENTWEDPDAYGIKILKWVTMKWDERTQTGMIGLRAEKSGRLLPIWWWTNRVHKMQEISQLTVKLLAFQKLCSIKFVSYSIIWHEKIMQMCGNNLEFWGPETEAPTPSRTKLLHLPQLFREWL